MDAHGNLYYEDIHHVYKAVPSGTGYSFRLYGYFDTFTYPSDPTPYWLAVDPTGTELYIEGEGNGPLLAYATTSVDHAGLQIIKKKLGKSSSQTLTYTFATAVTLGSYRVETQAATGLDFSDAGGGSCAPASYAAGASCTVKVTFTPKNAGVRPGAVTFIDSAGGTIANAPLTGTGTAPQLAYLPAIATLVLSKNSAFTGIAVDGNGTVYLADDVNKRVLRETPDGKGAYKESVVASGLKGPHGIAVDGSGYLVVSDALDEIVA